MSIFKSTDKGEELNAQKAASPVNNEGAGCVCVGGKCAQACACDCHCAKSGSCGVKPWKGGCSYLTALMFGLGIAAGPGAIGYFVAKVIGNNMHAKTVTVRGMAEREVKADYGRWSVAFEFSDKDLAKTQATIRQHQQTVHNFFKAQGFKDDEIELGMTGIEMKRRGKDDDEAYYVANSSVSISSKNVENIEKAYAQSGQLIETGLMFSADKYGHGAPTFMVTKFPEFRLEMVEEAMQSAQQTAEKILGKHGKIKGIKHIQQGSFSITDRDQSTDSEYSYGNKGRHKKIRVVHTVTFEVD